MRFDLARLPIGEMLIGFLLVMLAVTFVGAFIAVSDGGGEGGGVVQGSPTPVSPSPGVTTTPAGGILVTMGDNFFEFQGAREPAIGVPLGQELTFDLTNDGVAVHNMHIAGTDNEYGANICELGGDEPCSDPNIMAGGDTGTIRFRFDQPGTFVFRCDFHPIEMVGTVVVE